MQIHIRKQWRNHCSLRRTYLCLRPLTVLRNSGLQPFLDQPQHPAVGHAVLNELQRPFVIHVVKESSNVRIEHPLHSLAMDSHTKRIQRLMRAATRPESIRKASKVHLVNLVEDAHHSLLNDFVLQRRDAQRSLSTVGFRNVDSSRWLSPIRSTMNTAVQISDATFQSVLILLPRHTVHSRRSLPLQRVKAVPEQVNAQVVEQSSEPFLFPCLCYFSHTAQPSGHSFPALCRTCVGLSDVLLGPHPSLPGLR